MALPHLLLLVRPVDTVLAPAETLLVASILHQLGQPSGTHSTDSANYHHVRFKSKPGRSSTL
jgi:hypothetical protein